MAIPINVRTPDGRVHSLGPTVEIMARASSIDDTVFRGVSLKGETVIFLRKHILRPGRRVDVGPSLRPTGIRYQPVDNTERDQRELEAILSRVAALEERLSR